MPENPTIRYVPLEIKGEKLKLSFNFNAIAECETACGVNLFQALNVANANASQWRGLLWASLLSAQPKITLKDAGDLMQAALFEPGGLARVYEAIGKTMEMSMPDPDPTMPGVSEN